MSSILRISIVTPSFNQATFIEETLRSVRNQQCPTLDHIVMDGASTDGTVEILKRYSAMPGWEHLRWISEPDRGQSDALNKGFRMAKGDIIGWLNSDDRYESGCFDAVLKVFTECPEADVVYGDYLIMNGVGKPLLQKREVNFDWDILLCGLNYLAQPNVFFRRSIFDAVGYLDESLHYVMDYEFWLRTASHGFRFQHIPSLLAACRWHMDAKTVSQCPKINEELRLVREKYWNKRHFRSSTLQATYARYLNLHARSLRQWRKLRTRHVVDVIPASWYMKAWKFHTTWSGEPSHVKKEIVP
jgi:glycosyltransferase involved in cell wall biosynthesis